MHQHRWKTNTFAKDYLRCHNACTSICWALWGKTWLWTNILYKHDVQLVSTNSTIRNRVTPSTWIGTTSTIEVTKMYKSKYTMKHNLRSCIHYNHWKSLDPYFGRNMGSEGNWPPHRRRWEPTKLGGQLKGIERWLPRNFSSEIFVGISNQ